MTQFDPRLYQHCFFQSSKCDCCSLSKMKNSSWSPFLNSGIGGLIFLCCFHGKTSKQVLLQSRISSFFTFSIIYADGLHASYFKAEMFYLLTSCAFCCLLYMQDKTCKGMICHIMFQGTNFLKSQ